MEGSVEMGLKFRILKVPKNIRDTLDESILCSYINTVEHILCNFCFHC